MIQSGDRFEIWYNPTWRYGCYAIFDKARGFKLAARNTLNQALAAWCKCEKNPNISCTDI